MPDISSEEMARAEGALEKVRDAWMARDGVTAIDLGFKWSSGKMTTQLSIRVHVARKKQKTELSRAELFPEEVDGVPVDVIQATYAPQALTNARPEAAVEGRGKRFEVIPLGTSVGCKYSTAGTLGAKVIDADSGDEMILSNWHVLAGRRNVEAGISIWQPGWIDGGTNETNTIARLSRWVLGPYDAAVARLTGAREVLTTTPEGRKIVESTAPRLGMKVWKSGRSTGYTEGFIDGILMKVPLDYREAGTHLLEQVFRIVPRAGSGPGEISFGGDSGSMWVDESSGKAVGLHFAGEIGDTPEHALAHDITRVIDRLNVRFPGHIIPSPTPITKPLPEPTLPPPDQLAPPVGKPPLISEPPAIEPPPSTRPPGTPARDGRSFLDGIVSLLRSFLRGN